MDMIKFDVRTGNAVVQVNDKFYVIRVDGYQVNSTMASDMEDGGGTWYAGNNDSGVCYVATGRSKKAAISGFYRCVARDSEYLRETC